MASQLSKKAALPLANILATCRNNVSNTGHRSTGRRLSLVYSYGQGVLEWGFLVRAISKNNRCLVTAIVIIGKKTPNLDPEVFCCKIWSKIVYYLNTLRPRQNGRHFEMYFLEWKCMNFDQDFSWNVFLMFELSIFPHWFRSWLGTDQATTHYLNQWWLEYRRIYASLGLNEVINMKYGNIRHLSQCWLHTKLTKTSKVVFAVLSSSWRYPVCDFLG